MKYDPFFDEPNIVRYYQTLDDGTSLIVCGVHHARSVLDFLNDSLIPSGVDEEPPKGATCLILRTTSMLPAQRVKDALKAWMIKHHVGDLESLA